MCGINVKELIKLTKALSDETRLRTLNLLLERECCVCEVMQVLGISQPNASRTLSALYAAGLLNMRKEGRWALYSLNTSGMNSSVLKVVEAIGEKLKTDKTAIADLKKLHKAERLAPATICGCQE